MFVGESKTAITESDRRAAYDGAVSVLRGRKIALVGDFLVDAYLFGQTMRISREAPVPVVRLEREELRPGGAANTAANLAALGGEVWPLGVVGDDKHGAWLLEHLEGLGADVNGLCQISGGTSVKTRVVAGAFGTTPQQVLRLDEEADPERVRQRAGDIVSLLNERAVEADMVVVSDYGLGVVCEPVIAAVCELAAAGVRVCVDSRSQLLKFRGVEAVTPNVPEAEAAVRFGVAKPDDVRRAGTRLVRELGCQICLLTQGRGGMDVFRADGSPQAHVDIVGDAEVTDVTGAGDTVLAVFAGGLAGGLDVELAMRLANCAAGLVVGKVGAATVSRDELLQALFKYRVDLG